MYAENDSKVAVTQNFLYYLQSKENIKYHYDQQNKICPSLTFKRQTVTQTGLSSQSLTLISSPHQLIFV
jgi:hypothetical protein